MKIEIINDIKACKLIKGKLGIGQNLVSVHKGKVLHVIMVATKLKTFTGISWDSNLAVPKAVKHKIRYPISKGTSFHSNIICLSGYIL